MPKKPDVKQYMDILLYSQHCVERADTDVCCTKKKLYTIIILYHLVKQGGWARTSDIAAFLKIRRRRVTECLNKLFRLNIVEKRYIPGYRGVIALWRIREDVLSKYGQEYLLNTLGKHILMCLA
jgi:hypothetical protein